MKVMKKVWGFLQEDSWQSFLVTLALAFVVIKFVFFPGLSFLTGTSLPLVIVESCSMYHHEDGMAKSFESSSIYGKYGLELEDSGDWDFQNGFSKGDVIFVVGADDVEIGDVVIFQGGAKYPLIHRLVEVGDTYATKGDNYKTNSARQYPGEDKISEDQLVGKALFRVPFIGWAKLIFFEPTKDESRRGLC